MKCTGNLQSKETERPDAEAKLLKASQSQWWPDKASLASSSSFMEEWGAHGL